MGYWDTWAGKVGVEAAESLIDVGKEIVATKRTDTIAEGMEPIIKKMCLQRLTKNPSLKLMPETTLIGFERKGE
ncbi:MAG: NAD-binding protein [Pseudomonadota bacterium]